ncbi:LysM peptidoglycan-binding domain-containing protein [Candidatus Amarolinea aalborgensis]|uniref:LysM peptidoglycan-binding domain-containing protein n=1 Tax=Candidatus Amarolinea aalborgensis TaxID=2249329 RepID=UPI003BFA32C8
MGVFQSQKTVPVHVADLAPVAQAVANHFQAKGFEVQTQSSDKGWHISISKADTFKVVMGTKTALNVELAPKGDGTDVSAGIGVFGQHGGGLGGVLAGPLMLTQLWGMVQQSKLDDEAMAVAEKALQDVKAAADEAERAAAARVAAEKAAAERAAADKAAAERAAAAKAAVEKAFAERAAAEKAAADKAAAERAAAAQTAADMEARRREAEAEAAAKAQAAAAAAKAALEAEAAARAAGAQTEAEKAKAAAAAQAREALGAEPQQPGTRGVLGGSERIYVVVAGDSLFKIAAHFYGNGNRWPELFEANKDQIKNPRLIRPGQKLRIP